ncbi:Protein involved in initiation of plasmid replication [Cetobacterium ceti]|uniref:Protein involved in initiation of plasmid replication n=1 Tax=Cetobacterium ceti TaxID=180163 RepID=A0A1T4QBZ6_9FUSO|nr:replication initiation protein [Cetobacterium ceti]SKA01136.1 Protein involved in initiation of plasmid replication [Cetobacterium ceti]
MNLTFKNELNDLILTKMSAKELDLFIALLIKFSELKTDKIKVSFLEIKKIMGINPRTSNKQFANTLDKMIIKSHQTIQKTEETKGRKKYISIITTTIFDEEEMTIESRINPDFKNLFEVDNEKGTYTILDLKALVNFKSKYSKNLYRLLKQWETIGTKEFSIDEFRTVLDVPKSYPMKEVDKIVLTPILKELTEFFPKLNIEKIKNGRGAKVTKIIFTWQRIERKKKSFKKQQEVQTQGTGSKKLYNKELAAEKTLEIEKEIEGLKAKERLAEIVKTNLSSKVVEESIQELTSDEYIGMYYDYLKANNIEHSLYVKKAFDIINKNKVKIKENKKAL